MSQSSQSGSESAKNSSRTTPISKNEFICCKCKTAWPVTTRDLSYTDAHLEKVESFFQEVQASYDMRQRSFSNYTSVHVLLLSFKDDDLEVLKEILPLMRIFERLYHYQVEEPWQIPSQRSSLELMKRVTEFIDKYQNRDSLLIVYYGGHGGLIREQPSAAPIWTAKRTDPTPIVHTSGVQEQLEAAESDVLLLVDSCHSAHPSTSAGTGQGVTEVIAACGFGDTTPGVGPHSFTKALTDELVNAAREASPFYVTELFNRVLCNLKNWKSCPLRDDEGNIYLDGQNRPRYARPTRKTPVHGFLTMESSSPRIIVLAPLPDTLSHPPTDLDDATAEDDPLPVYLNPRSPRVLMSINITDEPLISQQWINWLRNAPNTAGRITLEAIYRSFSTLILVSMPVTQWSLLIPNPAYSFIGFVTSENSLPQPSSLSLSSNDFLLPSPSPNLHPDTRSDYVPPQPTTQSMKQDTAIKGVKRPSTRSQSSRPPKTTTRPSQSATQAIQQDIATEGVQRPSTLSQSTQPPNMADGSLYGVNNPRTGRKTVSTWTCCQCGFGVMLTDSTVSCLQCYVGRCQFCVSGHTRLGCRDLPQ